MERALTTGAFARLCGTTEHTLYHYDALGVLSPSVVGENGYRYYSPLQLETYHVIELLRELDMSLAEIRAYLDRRTPEAFAALMEREAEALDAKLARLERMRALTRRRAALTRQAMAARPGEITLGWEEEMWLVCTPALPMTSDWNISFPLARHVRLLAQHGVESPYLVGSLATRAGAETGDPAGYTHYYTRVERKPQGLEVYTRPAGEYLSLVHDTGMNGLPESYRRLLDYAGDRGLVLEEPFFEDMLLDELSVKGYEHYVLRLSVRVAGEAAREEVAK